MKKYIKWITAVICIISMTVFAGLSTHAEKDDSTDIFNAFIQTAIRSETFSAEDSTGKDITETIRNILSREGADAAHTYLKQITGKISWYEIKEYPATRAADETRNVTNYHYWIDKDTKSLFTREWQTKLTGVIYMDGNTGLIKRTSSPTLTLTWSNFGASLSPYMNSITVSASHAQSYAEFAADYHMYATLQEAVQGYTAGTTLDFKAHHHSFRAG